MAKAKTDKPLKVTGEGYAVEVSGMGDTYLAGEYSTSNQMPFVFDEKHEATILTTRYRYCRVVRVRYTVEVVPAKKRKNGEK